MTPELQRARAIIENTGRHLFLTGKAGTGKTTFLKEFSLSTTKRHVILAPTGIAAINCGGTTIHSFFQFPFAPYIPGTTFSKDTFRLRKRKIKLIRNLDLIIIDEISMVRADLLDQIDYTLRRLRRQHNLPFGGVQLLLIGDLQQLSPVAKDEEWNLLKNFYETPYFFSSKALATTNYLTLELHTVFRQQDEKFISLLNSIRTNKADRNILNQLNARVIPNFRPKKNEGYITLVTHNFQAQNINDEELKKLSGREKRFEARISGDFLESAFPTEKELILKKGAQVMFVKNDSRHRWFNGSIGEVKSLSDDSVSVALADGSGTYDVEYEEWTATRYELNEKTREVEEKVDGVFSQIPLRLAWAITIHKSQGLTFDKVIIDAHAAFAHGQTYVALSRCRTLEGIVLSTPLPASAVISDAAVNAFTTTFAERTPTENDIATMQREYLSQLADELFSFDAEQQSLSSLQRLLEEHLVRLYPKSVERGREEEKRFKERIVAVAEKFHRQYSSMIKSCPGDASTDEALQERFQRGAAYFWDELQPLRRHIEGSRLPTDNKEVEHRLEEIIEEATETILQHMRLLTYVRDNGMHLAHYQRQRAFILSGDEKAEENSEKKSVNKQQQKIVVPEEIQNKKLYDALVKYRREQAAEKGVPAYVIFSNKALLGIASLQPSTIGELLRVPGIGKTLAERHGENILRIVEDN